MAQSTIKRRFRIFSPTDTFDRSHECLLISLFSLENMCSLWNYAADIHSLWKWSELFMFILRTILVKRLNLKSSYELVSNTIAKKHSNSPSQLELNSFDGVHFSLNAIHYFIMQADACNNRNGVVSVTEWSARVHVDHHHTMRERASARSEIEIVKRCVMHCLQRGLFRELHKGALHGSDPKNEKLLMH